MKQLNIALIGYGRSGRDIHAGYLKTDSRFRVVAVVDALEVRRGMARAELGCKVYAEYGALLGRKDIDLVVNAAFSHQHAAISLDLITHGFNVLSEKPCAKTAAEVAQLEAAAQANGVLFTVYQQSRFAPYYEKVREVIRSGVLGRIVQVRIAFNGFARRWDWQCCRAFMGGSLYNTGPHPVDQALELLDYRDGMPNVLCRMDGANSFGDAEDYVKLVLTAPDRPLVEVEISSCDAYPADTYHIQGNRGGLKGSMTELAWRYYSLQEAPPQALVTEPLMDEDGVPLYCGEQLVWCEERWSSPGPRTFTYASNRLYSEVYENLTAGRPLTVQLADVRQQIAVIEECHRQNPAY